MIRESNCLLCGKRISDSLKLSFIFSFKPYIHPIICGNCRKQFIKIDLNKSCSICGRSGIFKNKICNDCLKWQHYFPLSFHNYSLYQYNHKMSEYMKNYKFNGNYVLRNVFMNEFSKSLMDFNRLIIPIPISPQTLQIRGFNQVIGFLNGINYINILKTKVHKKDISQSSLNRSERLKLKQPFLIDDNLKGQIKNKRVVIVDDVYTTGTTIRWAAKLIYQCGAKDVIGFTLAR